MVISRYLLYDWTLSVICAPHWKDLRTCQTRWQLICAQLSPMQSKRPPRSLFFFFLFPLSDFRSRRWFVSGGAALTLCVSTQTPGKAPHPGAEDGAHVRPPERLVRGVAVLFLPAPDSESPAFIYFFPLGPSVFMAPMMLAPAAAEGGKHPEVSPCSASRC